jgi:hypothetical protein
MTDKTSDAVSVIKSVLVVVTHVNDQAVSHFSILGSESDKGRRVIQISRGPVDFSQ